MRNITVAFLMLLPIALSAQQSDAITPQLLKDLETSCVQDAGFNAVHNALVQTDGRKLALAWEKIIKVDPRFSHKLADEKITDQRSSGRCWMFSGLNMFRRAAASALKSEEFEFSQNYLFLYDKLEKANIFLDAITKTKDRPFADRYVEWLMRTPIQEGGNWLGFVGLVKKYGAVPKDIMPETFSSSTSDAMNTILALRLKVAGVKLRAAKGETEIAAIRRQALRDICRILALNLGVPPHQFQWTYETKDKKLSSLKTYTPQPLMP